MASAAGYRHLAATSFSDEKREVILVLDVLSEDKSCSVQAALLAYRVETGALARKVLLEGTSRACADERSRAVRTRYAASPDGASVAGWDNADPGYPWGMPWVTGASDRLRIWDTTSGRVIFEQRPPTLGSAIEDVLFSADGTKLYVAGLNRLVWTAVGQREPWSAIDLEPSLTPASLAWANDARLLRSFDDARRSYRSEIDLGSRTETGRWFSRSDLRATTSGSRTLDAYSPFWSPRGAPYAGLNRAGFGERFDWPLRCASRRWPWVAGAGPNYAFLMRQDGIVLRVGAGHEGLFAIGQDGRFDAWSRDVLAVRAAAASTSQRVRSDPGLLQRFLSGGVP